MKMSYARFVAMIATSTVVMFGLMYLNTYALDHVFYSQTRMWMALLMGAVMALIMLAFMLAMYPSRKANAGIAIASVIVFAASLWLVRSQETVDDVSYMKAMIPHHSIAILTSERAGIEDVRVRELADGIAATQRKEIKEMDWLVQDIEENGPATTKEEADARPVPDFQGSASSLQDAQWSAREFLRALLALPLPTELGQQ